MGPPVRSATPTYDDVVTTTPSDDRPTQWQQPSWDQDDPQRDADFQDDGLHAVADPQAPLVGAVIVPGAPARPPSVVESTLNVVSAVTWPIAIVLAIVGTGSWWVNILTAIIVTTVCGAISGELKKRRKTE